MTSLKEEIRVELIRDSLGHRAVRVTSPSGKCLESAILPDEPLLSQVDRLIASIAAQET